MNIIIKTAVVLTNIITTTTLTNIMNITNITNIATTTMNIIILTADAAVAADTNMVTVNKKKHL